MHHKALWSRSITALEGISTRMEHEVWHELAAHETLRQAFEKEEKVFPPVAHSDTPISPQASLW